MNKPLINCIVETDENHSYFKFTKVDEGIRNKGNLGTFNGYNILSVYYPYFIDKNIYIFGFNKEYDNIKVNCNKEVILALEEAGCKVEIKNKPLINCAIETNNNNDYFEFIKVNESIRNEGSLGTFNGYTIRSLIYPDFYDYYKIIWVFGWNKEKDNIMVGCNKEVIDVLKEAGCEIIVK